MKSYMKVLAVAMLVMVSTGCTRVQTGEVGVRIGWDKQIQSGELMPGSFNQTLIGDVLLFPVKNVNVVVENLTPVAKDNSTMKDFDLVVVYNITPSQVSEIYSTMNRGFHAVEHHDIYLMYNYILQVARNAVYKAAREYEALTMNDYRQAMEESVKAHIQHSLKEEKLEGTITVSQVLIKNILPADSVVASANELVKAKNELQKKEVEVKTAEAEARRQQALASNSAQTITYMDAETRRIQAQAMLEAAKKGSLMMVTPGSTPLINVNK